MILLTYRFIIKLQSWGLDIKYICYKDILIYSNVENLVLVESQP